MIEVLILKPEFIPHQIYQNFVLTQLNEHYSNGILVFVKTDLPIIKKLWLADLSVTTSWLYDSYSDSNKGTKPNDPASMMHSYLLYLMIQPTTSITKWVDQLHRIPLYAILSGFELGVTPGVGIFYDFFDRIWSSDQANTKPKIKPKRKKKNKKKRPKKEKKETPKNPGIVEKLVDRYFRYNPKQKSLPQDRLFEFFQSQFLAVSGQYGLLGNLDRLSIAGDGTPLETARYPRSKPTCDCRAQGLGECNHPREYSQPDCDSGWDSSRERYFNGYHLYMLSASDTPYDLPLYPRLQPASRHDSIAWLPVPLKFPNGSPWARLTKCFLTQRMMPSYLQTFRSP